jgi:hypothetical protein
VLQGGESSGYRGWCLDPEGLVYEVLARREIPVSDCQLLYFGNSPVAFEEFEELVGIETLCPSGMTGSMSKKIEVLPHNRSQRPRRDPLGWFDITS